jgi:SanA protein
MLMRLAGVLGVAGVALAVGASGWVHRAGNQGLHDDVASAPARPVAIVLGARVHADGQPSAVLVDRLATALELYEGGKVTKILVSGDHAAPEYDETNAMRAWLVRRGVPDRDIFMDHAGLRTFDSMDRAARVFLVHGAIVCTQRFHLPRALFLARRLGIDAVGVAADRRTYLHRHRDAARELLARSIAFADVFVLGTRARHLGGPIPITGDGRVTHDPWSRDSPSGPSD